MDGRPKPRFPPPMFPMKRGLVREMKCLDSGCSRCTQNWVKHVTFGWCNRDPNCIDGSIEYECSEYRWSPFVISAWSNDPNHKCQGQPDRHVDSHSCYAQPFGSMNVVSNEGNVCNNCRNCEAAPRRYFYKYECRVGSGHGGLLRAEDENTANVKMDPHIWSIAMAILLFVCLIGVMTGYLIHRNREKKKTKEKSLLLLADNL